MTKSIGKHILIYRLGSIGDSIMALPCFHKVRNSYPESSIILLTNSPVKAKAAPLETVLGEGNFFDKVIHYSIGTRSLFTILKLILQIRTLEIDTVINLCEARQSRLSTLRDRLFFRAAGVTSFIGFPSEKEDFEPAVDLSTGQYEWEAKRLSRRIKSLGPIPLDIDSYWDLKLSHSENSAAIKIVESLSHSRLMLTVSLGTKCQSNDWGIQNWLSLLSQLKLILPDYSLVIVGSVDEKLMANQCLDVWEGAGLNLCGQTSPRVSAAVMSKAEIFIGHDSGPMHLAACVGTPCVGIFSARNFPGQWFPRGSANQIIYHYVECAGCKLEICLEKKKKCILSITVNEVKQAVLTILNRRSLMYSD